MCKETLINCRVGGEHILIRTSVTGNRILTADSTVRPKSWAYAASWRIEPEDGIIERQFGLQTADDGLRSAESMLFARERQQLGPQPFGAHGISHDLRLRWRHDAIVEALEEYDRACQPFDEMDRGSRTVGVSMCRIGSDQALEVP